MGEEMYSFNFVGLTFVLGLLMGAFLYSYFEEPVVSGVQSEEFDCVNTGFHNDVVRHYEEAIHSSNLHIVCGIGECHIKQVSLPEPEVVEESVRVCVGDVCLGQDLNLTGSSKTPVFSCSEGWVLYWTDREIGCKKEGEEK